MLRRRGIERLTGDLGSWDDAPVLAYGFEDLTGAEWRLIEALAARGDVHVSLPYEPGRAAYASLSRTARDLGGARGRRHRRAAAARSPSTCRRRLAHLERQLFDDDVGARAARRRDPLPRGSGPPRHARARRRGGARARPRRDRTGRDRGRLPVARAIRVPLETAFAALGVPVGDRGEAALRVDAVRAVRCSRSFASPGSAASDPSSTPTCARRTPGSSGSEVDFVEGRLRGRGRRPRRPHDRGHRRAPQRAPAARCSTALRARTHLSQRCARSVRAMLRNAYGVVRSARRRRVASATSRAADAVSRTLDELERLARAGRDRFGAEDVLAALDRATVRASAPASRAAWRCSTSLRARTRRFDTVFVLGLEQGTLPRRARRRAVPRRRTRREPRRSPRRPSPAARCREPRPLPLLRPPARGRGGGSRSSARRSATRARRASRARSGRRCASSSTPTTCATRPSEAPSPR